MYKELVFLPRGQPKVVRTLAEELIFRMMLAGLYLKMASPWAI